MKTQYPLISVIIPVYNASKTITDTLNSAKNQIYKNLEIIIVDDGSTDESLAVIKVFKKQNTDLNIVLIEKANGGVSSARNAALKQASGEFIALLDADDEWKPGKLTRQMEIMAKHPAIDFLGTNRNQEYHRRFLWKKFDLLTKIGVKFLLVKYIFVVPTIIFKSEILGVIGYFNENQKHTEDNQFFIRIASKFNCYLLNEDWVLTGKGKAHIGSSGLSANIKQMEIGELNNIKYAYKNGLINIVEYVIILAYSIFKYLRRIIIVKLLK